MRQWPKPKMPPLLLRPNQTPLYKSLFAKPLPLAMAPLLSRCTMLLPPPTFGVAFPTPQRSLLPRVVGQVVSPADRRNPRSAKKALFAASPPSRTSPGSSRTNSAAASSAGDTVLRRSAWASKPTSTFKGFEVGVKKRSKATSTTNSKKAVQAALKEAGLVRDILTQSGTAMPLSAEERNLLSSYCGILNDLTADAVQPPSDRPVAPLLITATEVQATDALAPLATSAAQP